MAFGPLNYTSRKEGASLYRYLFRMVWFCTVSCRATAAHFAVVYLFSSGYLERKWEDSMSNVAYRRQQPHIEWRDVWHLADFVISSNQVWAIVCDTMRSANVLLKSPPSFQNIGVIMRTALPVSVPSIDHSKCVHNSQSNTWSATG